MWTRPPLTRDGRQQNQAERLPLLRGEVEEERGVADHPVLRPAGPVGGDEGGEVETCLLALLRAREGDLRAEAAGLPGDGAGGNLADAYRHAAIELGRQGRRVELSCGRGVHEPDGRSDELRRCRQRLRARDLPFVFNRHTAKLLGARSLAGSCSRESGDHVVEHLVAVTVAEHGDRAPCPHKGVTEWAQCLLGLARVRAVQHRGVAVELGV